MTARPHKVDKTGGWLAGPFPSRFRGRSRLDDREDVIGGKGEAMEKAAILQAIKDITEQKGGTPPGAASFGRQTGIGRYDWFPHFWIRWGDALTEAGFEPNKFFEAYTASALIQQYIRLVRDLKHVPVDGELPLRAKTDNEFPSTAAFRRFGGKEKLLAAVFAFCRESPGHEWPASQLAVAPCGSGFCFGLHPAHQHGRLL